MNDQELLNNLTAELNELRAHHVQVSEAWAATETRARKAEARVAELEAFNPFEGQFNIEIDGQTYSASVHTAIRNALMRDLPSWAQADGDASIRLGDITVSIGDDGELSSQRLRARVTELEAAQVPRPMSEAPRDGTWILAWEKHSWVRVKWSTDKWVEWHDEFIAPDRYLSWLPCPPDPEGK